MHGGAKIAARGVAVLAGAGLLLSAALSPIFPAAPTAEAAGRCWGTLHASPATAQVGTAFTLSGSGYHCLGLGSKPVSHPTVFLYRPGNGIVPGVGFITYTVNVHGNGTFSQTTTMPARLRFITAINGGPNRSRRVPIGAGIYYLAIRPTASSLPPASQADARITVSLNTPSAQEIKSVMARTVEVNKLSTYFVQLLPPLTIVDGRGTGTLTVAVGIQHTAPGGNGPGELAFFWHNRTFAGWNAPYATAGSIGVDSTAPGAFRVTYRPFRKGDRSCCPTGTPLHQSFGWSGHLLIRGTAPPSAGAIHVKLMP